MMKRIFPALLAVLLLTGTAYAAAPESVTTNDGASITITDITERQGESDFALPQFYPTDIQQKTEDGVKLLLKIYEVAPNVSASALIESGLAQNGVEYELRDILRAVSPDGQEKKTASQTVTVESDSDKQVDIVKLLQSSLPYEESGYTGQLRLDESSISTEVASTEGYHYAVTDVRDYSGLVRNDPALIAKTVQKNGVTLALCNVKWSGGENEPNPMSYSATATYKGSASGSKASGYMATATYTGEVTKAIPGNVTYTLIYAAKPIAPIELPKNVNWTPILFGLIGVIGIGGIGTGIVFLLRLRRQNANPAFADGEAVYDTKTMYKPSMLAGLEDVDDE